MAIPRYDIIVYYSDTAATNASHSVIATASNFAWGNNHISVDFDYTGDGNSDKQSFLAMPLFDLKKMYTPGYTNENPVGFYKRVRIWRKQ